MSIRIGYSNYSYSELSQESTIISLNSFDNSNIIVLNTKNGSSTDAFINYRDAISAGISSNTFVFKNGSSGESLMELDEAGILLMRDLSLVGDYDLNGTILSSNGHTDINKDVSINLNDGDGFSISSNGCNVFSISSNTDIDISSHSINIAMHNVSIGSLYDDKVILSADYSNINISNDVYINDGVLYVNEISGFNNKQLVINDAVYSSASIEKFVANTFVNIENTSSNVDEIPFKISKRYGSSNIVQIDSFTGSGVFNNLYLNNNGLLGIGTSTPDASISIRKISDNIITYRGDAPGDAFTLSGRGNVGIGIAAPRGQLHIRRADDLSQGNTRKLPLLNMQIDYDANSNISNVFNTLADDFRLLQQDDARNITIYNESTTGTSTTQILGGESLSLNISNNFYMLNKNVFDNSLGGNIKNASNFTEASFKHIDLDLLEGEIEPTATSFNTISFTNRFIYPSSIHVEEDTGARDIDIDDINNYIITYRLLVMTTNTKEAGGYQTTNAQNFVVYDEEADINTGQILFDKVVHSIGTYSIKCRIEFIIEINNGFVDFPFQLTKMTEILIPAPDFLTMRRNNQMITSISPEGTLSLGSRVPDKYKNVYTMYSVGSNYLRSIDTDRICAITSNISFDNNGLKDISSIDCDTLTTNSFSVGSLRDIEEITGTMLSMKTGNFSGIVCSNLSFVDASNSYLSFSNTSVHIGTRLTVGKSGASSEIDSASLKITVDNQVIPSQQGIHCGVLITNEDQEINAGLCVKTKDSTSIPYVSVNNSTAECYLRLKSEMNDAIRKDFFQIANRNGNDVAYFIQNDITDSVLSFGENDIVCIDSKKKISPTDVNNYTSKVSIGVPYGAMNGYDSAYEYFNDKIKNSDTNDTSAQYMLNVFGNTRIANIHNEVMISCKSVADVVDDDTKNTIVGINCEPDSAYTLKVAGDVMVEGDIVTTIRNKKVSLLKLLGLLASDGQLDAALP